MDDIDAEEVDDAFECVLLWNDRIDDTDDDVEFRPFRPLPEARRYDERGVCGCGDSEFLLGGGVVRCVVMYGALPLELRRTPECDEREAELPAVAY